MFILKLTLAVLVLDLSNVSANMQPGSNNGMLDKRNAHHQLNEAVTNLFKRQLDGTQSNGVTEFPERCQSQCEGYEDLNERCAGTPSEPIMATQDEMWQCACDGGLIDLAKTCMKCTPESFATGSDGTDFSRLLTFLESQCTLLGGGSAGADTGADKVEAEGTIASELRNQKDSTEMPIVSAATGKGTGSILKPQYVLSVVIVALAEVLAVP